MGIAVVTFADDDNHPAILLQLIVNIVGQLLNADLPFGQIDLQRQLASHLGSKVKLKIDSSGTRGRHTRRPNLRLIHDSVARSAPEWAKGPK